MKVSKLFHWLYASVMFIPLLILPILGLAVRSDNNFQPMEVQAQDYEVVDFNQQVKSSLFNPIQNNWQSTNATLTINEGYTSLLSNGNNGRCYLSSQSRLNVYQNHVYLIKLQAQLTNVDTTCRLTMSGSIFNRDLEKNLDIQVISLRFTMPTSSNDFWIGVLDYNNSNYEIKLYSINFYDLTQAFGNGNEPTTNEFLNLYPLNNYDYTLSKKELLNVGAATYNDTDVGSQMIYTLYNATDKYFNFNQFLGIGNLFNWFQINVFNGNAPLGFIIFWNLLIYWLLVSIAWLIFDIAMFVPKLAHRWLDKASLE